MYRRYRYPVLNIHVKREVQHVSPRGHFLMTLNPTRERLFSFKCYGAPHGDGKKCVLHEWLRNLRLLARSVHNEL
jgi:hypothetical protein